MEDYVGYLFLVVYLQEIYNTKFCKPFWLHLIIHSTFNIHIHNCANNFNRIFIVLKIKKLKILFSSIFNVTINKTIPIMTNSKMHPDPISWLLQENPQIIFLNEISQNKMLLMTKISIFFQFFKNILSVQK